MCHWLIQGMEGAFFLSPLKPHVGRRYNTYLASSPLHHILVSIPDIPLHLRIIFLVRIIIWVPHGCFTLINTLKMFLLFQSFHSFFTKFLLCWCFPQGNLARHWEVARTLDNQLGRTGDDFHGGKEARRPMLASQRVVRKCQGTSAGEPERRNRRISGCPTGCVFAFTVSGPAPRLAVPLEVCGGRDRSTPQANVTGERVTRCWHHIPLSPSIARNTSNTRLAFVFQLMYSSKSASPPSLRICVFLVGILANAPWSGVAGVIC